ncbi:Undecaprenyl-phosphate glucose phosphotransferase [Anaerobacterium chartisolvens]|uniref:Undecaprenyl-phosphate glucose phosphotransferase n=1 Tax=Anaerobacterium chartisolvens TaxID=1297424 RepID=A0A369BCM0_9FIRM|nr:undecaprenyl-phosphate glucose phosphotransferase [Anaerobacterium chartisolvens]RCX19273.1 Undecaprenyl-phosphate glucose phosphotransferase [Anaerobacterium chartisolvens]
MSGEKKKFLKRSVVMIDALLIVNAYFIAYFARNMYFGAEFGYMRNFDNYSWVLTAAVIVLPLFMTLFKSYDTLIEDRMLMVLFKTAFSIFVGTVFMGAVFYFMAERNFSRLFFGIFAVASFVLVCMDRLALKAALLLYIKRNSSTKNILIVGCGNLGMAYFKRITRYKYSGCRVAGFLKMEKDRPEWADSINILGNIDRLEFILQEHNVSEVVVAVPSEDYDVLKGIIDICDREGIRVKILPGYFEYLPVSTRVEDLDGLPVLHIREIPLDSIGNRIVKRAFDIVFSLAAIVFFSPLYILIAIGVKLSSSGPVFFRQERVGAENRTFMMLKFRSMRLQREEKERKCWTTKNDSRVTSFGAFIRKTSLDEIPQFFNVLMGDMSIVGPRPERPYWVNKFKQEIPDYMLRHYIKSGITGWAQVNGLRGDTSISDRIKCDNYYIYNWSLWMDIKILLMTVFKGFVNQNAY